MDEADRLLDISFESHLLTILNKLPKEKQTLLFTATISDEIKSLQFKEPPFIYECSDKFEPVEKLDQRYLFIPQIIRHVYLIYLLQNMYEDQTMIIFVSKCETCEQIRLLLRQLDIKCTALHSQMSQNERIGSLAKFKSNIAPILIATDLASRGLDIPKVQVVLHYDLPASAVDYMHRIGRTARAGRGGQTLALVTERDIDIVKNIEEKMNKKLELLEGVSEKQVLELLNQVSLAKRMANMTMIERKFGEKKKLNDRKNGVSKTRRISKHR
jgi:ATP-dependent RNA helicase DDX49/DBP8